MRITRLSLTNFRNYRHVELTLPPHVLVVFGENAQGKTNLLEAVHVLATTRSHRASNDRDMVNCDAAGEELPYARLCAEVHKAKGDMKVEIVMQVDGSGRGVPQKRVAGTTSVAGVRKRIRVNDVPRRALDFVGQVNVVIFSAQDMDLVAGTPGLCRRYLDLVASQTDSRYLRCLQRYNRVLLQRNHLLRLMKEGRQGRAEQLEFWDRELVDNGSYIVLQRRRLVSELNELAEESHQGLSGGSERLEVVYLPNIGGEQSAAEIGGRFEQTLNRSRQKEIYQGVTLVGPHRDNLQFLINGADMSRYGSRGQQQTVVLSLKLAEAGYMRAKADDPPILLLDDVFSDLDRARRQHLLESIASFQQVLITATEPGYFDPSFLERAAQLRVKEGKVEPV